MEGGDSMEEEKIQTHIEGFDELLGGGIPKGHVVLLSGPPGVMKSSIAYNILYNNARMNKITGAYFSLEQSKENLLRQMDSLGFHQEDVKEHINIIDMASMRKKLAEIRSEGNLLDLFKLYADNIKEEEGYDIMAVDSISVLLMIAQIRDNREQMFHLFDWLRSLKSTVFLVSESPRDPDRVSDEEFLADGVIHVLKERVGTVDTQLRIVIDKMRAADHSRGYFNLTFKDKHLRVSPII
jgi:KaiC/GvpD/RAD55 family RecA-like ATPase